ncbi:hypothetical protein IOD13_15850 [Brevibacterium casei]|nr:hypothetical protein [Brevibacterium casei]
MPRVVRARSVGLSGSGSPPRRVRVPHRDARLPRSHRLLAHRPLLGEPQTDWVTTLSYLGVAGLLIVDIGLWAWAGYRWGRPVPLIIAAVPVVLTYIVVGIGVLAGAF